VGKILTIDLGTTLFKFALFDRSGRLYEVCRIPPPLADAAPGRMELPADAFATSIAQGIATLQGCIGSLADVEAVTFATQTNSFLLLDAKGIPLTPIILWPDDRAVAVESEARSRCESNGFSATTGVKQISFQFMVAKLLWLQRQSLGLWRRRERLCLISDYLTLLLTGKHFAEAGAAALTGLVDIHRCQWWPEALARFEIDERIVPSIVRAGADLGPIAPAAARQFGLPASCRFVVGCLDQYAGAIGAGNIEPNMLSETTGTALATVRCADRFFAQAGPGVFQGPAFRERLYWQMAFGDVSANYLQWYRDRLPDRPDFEQLTALAEPIALGADGLRLRTGVALSDIPNVFEGMTPHHTRGHAVRCILESVAVALRGQIASLSDGAVPTEVRCAGGAARSDLWLQIKADILGAPTVATTCPEPTSLGAAMLAEATIGATDLRQIARQWVYLKTPHRPDPTRHQQYQSLYRNPIASM
jgi:xylulokinase